MCGLIPWLTLSHVWDDAIKREIRNKRKREKIKHHTNGLKVGILVGFGVGLLENTCWTLLWLVFGPCMTGCEIGFDSGAAVRNW